MNLGAAAVLAVFAVATRPCVVRSADTCSAPARSHVRLVASAVDPDVFVWDSRDRLARYAAGQWGNTQTIFAHTVLVKPGTEAVVVACADAAAVGIKITKGPYKGRYGWVFSSDAHSR